MLKKLPEMISKESWMRETGFSDARVVPLVGAYSAAIATK